MKKGFKHMSAIFLIIILLAVVAKVYYDTNLIRVNRIEIHTEKLLPGQSLSILQLSDLHGKSFGKNNERLLKKMEALKPDIVVITGDMIDRNTKQLETTLELAEKIATYNKRTYYVSGNHEWGNSQKERFFKGLTEKGIHILDNKNELLYIGDMAFQLAGLGDAATKHDEMQEALRDIDHTKLTVLLSHAPDVWEEKYPEAVDVILSGHTHGGQIRLPLIGALVAPDQGYFPKYDKGVFTLHENQYLYIDSGLGTSWFDARFLNQSQISMVTLRN